MSSISGEYRWKMLEAYNELTRLVAKNESVLCIDLARKLPKSSAYFYDFYHFNNEGAKKVAKIISSELEPFLIKKFPRK